MMESREEVMVSPVGDSNPTLRIAHFLKPSLPLISDISSPSLASPFVFDPKKWKWCLTVSFSGWQCPPKKWAHWVDSLHSKYKSLWKKVGIFEAIMGTMYYVKKNEDLIFGVVEKWCSETNTFLFPWGEATITLEDMMILGGYPVLGDSVHKPIETQEMKEIEEKLILARRETSRRPSRKACLHTWIGIFMNSGREIEHEAFLVAWLSMFVFPTKSFLVRSIVFPIAIYLARGNALALAPAVLASIYKDLSMLKQTMVALTRNAEDVKVEANLQLDLPSPLHLVQIWLWERLLVLQPKPNFVNHGYPLLGKWHGVKALKIYNVRSVIDSAKDDFMWRPYARFAGKHRLFYSEKSMWVPLDHILDNETEIVSFIMCMRISELVGLDCIEHYLPHRVSMQFGMDQDIPGSVTRMNDTPEIAWDYYSRPIIDSNVYIPSRFFEPDVTTRYVEWWKKSVQGHQDPVKNLVKRKRSQRSLKKRCYAAISPPPGFPPKYRIAWGSGNFSGFFLENYDHATSSKLDLQMKPHVEIETEASRSDLQEAREKVNEKQSSLAYDRVNQSSDEEDNANAFDMFIVDLENRICKLEGVVAGLKQ